MRVKVSRNQTGNQKPTAIKPRLHAHARELLPQAPKPQADRTAAGLSDLSGGNMVDFMAKP
jgi:hypothetical protein